MLCQSCTYSVQNMWRISILISLLATAVNCVDHNIYLDCSRVSFCSEFRYKILDESSIYTAATFMYEVIDNLVTFPIYLPNAKALDVKIWLLTDYRFRIQIAEENHTRYEIQDDLAGDPIIGPFIHSIDDDEVLTIRSLIELHSVTVIPGPPFEIRFSYNDINQVVLAGNRFVMENTAESKAFGFGIEFENAIKLYGLFHHTTKLALGETATSSSDPYRLRNTDTWDFDLDSPISMSGSIPVIYGHSAELTSGIFLNNAAQMWVDISYMGRKPSSYFMVESGLLDLFVFLGPRPADVVSQYVNITGAAPLPQLWTLGYHQSRSTYGSQGQVKEVVALMDIHNFPMDAIWLDSGHTNDYRYFQWNPKTFSDPIEMQKNISTTGRKIVTVSNPHFKVDGNYDVYAGAKDKFFVRWANGSDYEGESLPGTSSWIDFLNPEARDYYASWYSYDKFKDTTETIAGICNDMNEPSILDITTERTFPLNALHHDDISDRDVHNLYGLLHTKATHAGLLLRDDTKRPFVLSRSQFAGSQRYAAVWTGNNLADWRYLRLAVSECLTANLLGQVFCGADIGGFSGNPTDELLQRWYQAAIWIPFFRGHSSGGSNPREPYLFSEGVQNVIRQTIQLRYKHLPVWYTLFFEHTDNYDPLIRPLFYHYPTMLEYDDHFLVGPHILVRPVMETNVKQVTVRFPGTYTTDWFRADNGSWTVYGGGSEEKVDVDINTSPFFYRTGSIITRKDTERYSSSEMWNDPITLYINVDNKNSSQGQLYVDDYTSFEYSNNRSYLYVQFKFINLSNGVLIRQVSGNSDGINVRISRIVINRKIDPEKFVSTTTYSTTSDGTPLDAIDIAQHLRMRSEDLTLYL